MNEAQLITNLVHLLGTLTPNETTTLTHELFELLVQHYDVDALLYFSNCNKQVNASMLVDYIL